jgi:hypothetical protein
MKSVEWYRFPIDTKFEALEELEEPELGYWFELQFIIRRMWAMRRATAQWRWNNPRERW